MASISKKPLDFAGFELRQCCFFRNGLFAVDFLTPDLLDFVGLVAAAPLWDRVKAILCTFDGICPVVKLSHLRFKKYWRMLRL